MHNRYRIEITVIFLMKCNNFYCNIEDRNSMGCKFWRL